MSRSTPRHDQAEITELISNFWTIIIAGVLHSDKHGIAHIVKCHPKTLGRLEKSGKLKGGKYYGNKKVYPVEEAKICKSARLKLPTSTN